MRKEGLIGVNYTETKQPYMNVKYNIKGKNKRKKYNKKPK